MPVRKSLTDLYQTGRELTFTEGERPVIDAETGEPKTDPESGEAVMEPEVSETVWVAKLTQLDHRAAVRRADAHKSLILIAARERAGEDWDSSVNVVRETFGDDRGLIIDYLVGNKLAERQEAIGAEVEGEEDDDGEPSEWKKDNYLQGLYDAWNGVGSADGAESMRSRYAQNPNDPEAKRVYAEICRFIAQIDERLNEERAVITAEFEDFPTEDLIDQLVVSHLESYASTAWMEEFNACRVWLGLRKAQRHQDYYLQKREDVDKLHPRIIATVIAAIDEMAVDATEGKGWPATRTSLL